MRLRDKVALITGGSRRIGRAVAVAFAREGAKVAVVGVSDHHALTQVADEIAALGEAPLALRADVSQKAEVDGLVQQVVARWGRVDIPSTTRGLFTPASSKRSAKRSGVRPWRCTLPAPSCVPKPSCQS